MLERTLAQPAALAALDHDALHIEHKDVELRGVRGSHRIALVARAGAGTLTPGRHTAAPAVVRRPEVDLESEAQADPGPSS